MNAEISLDDLKMVAAAVRGGDRRVLAQAITLIESTRDDHRRRAEALVAALLPASGGAIRVGLSGAPGVGKSTLIEAFGLHLIAQGHRLAVLAVDPSSARGGGAILGDKARMPDLARSDSAFIRPSPTGGTLGGVARRTREAIIACEAAGYDWVIVETVGVGQSEIAVRDMVDMFVLLLQPGAGDDLQGIKRGIVEIADLLVVTKADGGLADAARHTAADYGNALTLLRPASPDWTPSVRACSAIEKSGLDEIREEIMRFHAVMTKSGAWKTRRARQAVAWMWSEVDEMLQGALRAAPGMDSRALALEGKVADGSAAPTAAAADLVAEFLGK